MQVVSLRIHPVKSTAITPVSSAYIGFAGLRGDREWMVVDENAAMVSARELPGLFRVQAAPLQGESAAVTLSAAGSSYTVRAGDSELSATMFTRPPMRVRETTESASQWLEQVTGRAGLEIVQCAYPEARRLNPEFSRPDDRAAFQDGYPVTVASLASLRQLNAWIEEAGGDPVQIDRFRPNVVIDGDEPFAEDNWTSVQIGGVRLRAAKPVDRCVMTLVDPASPQLAKGKEPIRTLSRHRKWDGKTWFCHHLIPDTEGEIAIGDPVVPQQR
ncbi:molybdenum cofactor biosysynthesis protein [Flexivirga endophytica]|uniref:Molybdenum cofactor biosysynthesis protein n=1 Tax=Flexivirga endophytica TaxID=1849103 RepID=A0A916TKP1_9MICO|nr:MOSC domain-containing protein [Flexivirga endophytica]GGB45915.1 molybdenum cofactor biosysynthesis protein [Flexivirga endophytica]GHB66139.1 molybdenum cofactor biosysynthesis protein [Flexivirga endophytica]